MHEKKFSCDYLYRINYDPGNGSRNLLPMGLDTETEGHVFPMHFTNANGMNERVFFNESTNNCQKVDTQFGFDLSPAFS